TAMPARPLDKASAGAIIEAFHAAHEKRYGRRQQGAAVELVTLNVTAKGDTVRPTHAPLAAGDGTAAAARKGRRSVYFRDIGRVDCEHYERPLLRAGDRLAGPAIVQAV